MIRKPADGVEAVRDGAAGSIFFKDCMASATAWPQGLHGPRDCMAWNVGVRIMWKKLSENGNLGDQKARGGNASRNGGWKTNTRTTGKNGKSGRVSDLPVLLSRDCWALRG